MRSLCVGSRRASDAETVARKCFGENRHRDSGGRLVPQLMRGLTITHLRLAPSYSNTVRPRRRNLRIAGRESRGRGHSPGKATSAPRNGCGHAQKIDLRWYKRKLYSKPFERFIKNSEALDLFMWFRQGPIA